MGLVKNSIYFSLFTQFIVLLIGVYAMMKPLSPNHKLLGSILSMENIVQLVEFIFYVWFGFFVYNIERLDIAKYRYYDWIFTTPVMLFTIMVYLKYNTSQKEKSKSFTLSEFIHENKENITGVFISNFIMLLVGYLQEIGKMSIVWSSVIGFAGLFNAFRLIYSYVGDIYYNQLLFWFMFIIWNLYGVAAFFTNKIKNTMYNMLDLFAKNFFGLFIAYQILSL